VEEASMQYVMITHWKGHWDNLPDHETLYTDAMLRAGMNKGKLVENAQTIFIKVNEKNKKPERAWVGSVYALKAETGKIRFKVRIEKEIPCPKKYCEYTEGWYAVEGEIAEVNVEKEISGAVLYPPFFDILKTTSDWKEFEFYTSWLLKLLGIHEFFRFEEQKGKADGFFTFSSLAVMYDCTLQDDFETSKRDQIANYCSQLKSGKIEIGVNTANIHQYQKQVWIITRGRARLMKKIDEVIVKEMPVEEIISFYRKRIEENLNENDLLNLFMKPLLGCIAHDAV
jgi:hypothetical protein